MKLPINISVEIVKRVEDTFTFHTLVMVPDSDKSTTELLVSTDPDRKPEIERLVRDGLDELTDDDLKRRFLLLMFDLAQDQMFHSGGTRIDWSITDISRLLDKNFGSEESAFLRYVLSAFVSPQVVVSNQCVARID